MDKKVIHTVIDVVADRFADAIAIEEQSGVRLTYRSLKVNSTQVAEKLLCSGIDKGGIVGVFLPPGAGYIVSIIGVNKAGAIFLPLSPDYPVERLKALLQFIRPRYFITNKLYKGQLQHALADAAIDDVTILEDIPEPVQEGLPHESISVIISGDDSNYLLYTSGSTGEPKIIEGVHKGLSHFVHWETEELALDHTVRTSWLAPISFDVSMRDIFVPLINGGTVCIPSSETKSDPTALLPWLAATGVNLLHIVPSVFRLFIAFLEKQSDPSLYAGKLERILFAGEPLYYRDIIGWQRLTGNKAQLVNLYGPTETTLAKVFNRIELTGEESMHDIVPLGKPITNTMVLILKDNQVCQIGEIGEICIKTPFASKGYFRNETLTKEKFVQNPLHNEYKDIIYKTGDMGRYLPDRSIEFTGRSDNQVKVRGNRVELAEVEKVIQQHPAIRQAIVVPLNRGNNETVLACYYLGSDNTMDVPLTEYLPGYLPDYMVPSYFIRLESFPLNLNGKINRKALPVPEEVLYDSLDYTAPAGAVEILLAGIWSGVLGLKRVGVNNSFFELGGHSLNAVKVVGAIYAETGKQVSLKTFFDHPTVRLLAEILMEKETETADIIPPLSPATDYEVSHQQKRLLILDQAVSKLAAYNMVIPCYFNKSLDVEAFRKSFKKIVERHESLRSRFIHANGSFRQQIMSSEEAKFDVEVNDVADQSHVLIEEIIKEESQYHFDLRKAPLIRARLFKLEPGRYFFIINLHHIISDGWSVRIIINELVVLYNFFINGLVDPLEPMAIQYKDYAAWLNNKLSSGQLILQRDYWHNKLGDITKTFELPTDSIKPANQGYRGDNYLFELGNELSANLKKLAKESNTGIFSLLLAVIDILLYSKSGLNDITTGIPVAGRNNPALDRQVGFFLNNLVIRAVVNRNESFREFSQRIQLAVAEAMEHQDYPFDKLVEELQGNADNNRNSFYNVLVVMNNEGLNFSKEDMTLLQDQFGYEPCDFKPGISKLDLSFFLNEGASISIDIEYDTQLFSETTIREWADDLLRLMLAVVANDLITIGDLSWKLSGIDREKALKNKMTLISEEF